MNKIIVNKKKLYITLFLVFLLLSIVFVFIYFKTQNYDSYIDKVLQTEAYSYLPKEAQNYIKDVYLETGEILLTERNKKANAPYLNQEYVEYLSYINDESIEKEIADNVVGYDVIPEPTVTDYVESSNQGSSLDLPTSFDLRDVDGKNFVTPIKDQESTGLCWAFATNAQAESHLLMKNNVSYQSGISQLFSEMQIDYATADNAIIDGAPNYSFSRILGGGGTFGYATTVMMDNLGLVDVGWRNFEDYDYKPMEKNKVYNFKNSKYEVTGAVDYPKLDLSVSENVDKRNSYLNDLKKLIMENGGAYVGTVDPTSRCSITVNGYKLMYDDDKCASTGHAMQIIGWDDDLEYSFCSGEKDAKDYYYLGNAATCQSGTVINGKGAWLIKNSWGTTLPYVYLAYDSLGSSINLITEMESKNWDNYAPIKDTSSVGFAGTYNKKLEGVEKLNKVKIRTAGQNADFNICFTSNNEDINYCKNVSTTFPGIYTVDLLEDNITFNSDLSVKVTSSSSGVYATNLNVYTNNVSLEPKIVTEDVEYENKLTNIDKYIFRIPSKTVNISENALITYKVLDSQRNEISSDYSYSENIVFANEVFSKLVIDNDLPIGTYILQTILDGNVLCESKLVINDKIVTIEGSGTEEDPYIINTPSQLNLIRLDRFAFYKLGNDIDMTYDTQNENGLFYNEGKGWEPIRFSTYSTGSAHYLSFSKGFAGGFEGDNHKIIGLYINRPDENGVGLFANTYNENFSNLHIRNVSFVEPNITGNDWVGTLLGVAYGTTYERKLDISNIQVIGGSIKGNNYIGGIIGLINSGSYLTVYGTSIPRHIFSNLYNSATINANNYAGGIFGMVTNIHSYGASRSPVTIDNVLNKGFVRSENLAGGLVGYLLTRATNDISIKESMNTGKVLGKTGSNEIVGEFGTSSQGNLNLTNLYYVNDTDLSFDNGSVVIDNVSKKSLSEIKDNNNYLSWPNVNTNWTFDVVNQVSRMPVLSFVDFDYTKIEDVEIEVGDEISIYNLIEPDIDAVKNIDFEVGNFSIVNINDEGIMTGKGVGETEINISSYYDGYIGSLKVKVSAMKTTITFNSNGGTSVSSITKYPGEKITIPDNPIRENYKFEGWYTDNETFTEKFEFDVMPAEDRVLYAKWIPISYQIKYNPNGGEGNMANSEFVYDKAQNLSKNIFVRDGYIFEGWSTLETSSEVVYQDEASVKNLTNKDDTVVNLYAVWKPISYQIKYNSNGGSGTMPNSGFVYDKAQNLSKNVFAKEGYTFEGWSTSETSSEVVYKDETSVKNLTNKNDGVVNLYVVWKPISYQIKYNANGGVGTMASSEFVYDKAQNLSKNVFLKEGYTFEGWSTSETSSEVVYKDETSVKNLTNKNDGVVNLYAVWKPILYQIKYNSNGGEGTMANSEFVYDKAQNLFKNVFAKEGYVFGGWAISETSNEIVYQDEASVKNLTNKNEAVVNLYAVWTKLPPRHVEIKMVNGVSDSDYKNVEYNHGVSIKVSPNKGYNDPNVSCTNGEFGLIKDEFLVIENITNDTTCTVAYKVIEYKIKYILNEGKAINPDLYTVETNTFKLNNPIKEGYVFVGWTGSNGSDKEKDVIIEKGTIGDKTYTANYEVAKYTITYKSDEFGSITGKTSETVNYKGNPSGTTQTPLKDYVNLKWVVDKDVTLEDGTTILKGSPISETQIKQIEVKDDLIITIYHYSVKHNVKYESSEDGTISGIVTEEVAENSNPLGTMFTPNKGYEISHFIINKDVTLEDGTIVLSGNPISEEQIKQIVIKEDLTIKATYEKKEYIIKYTSDINSKIIGNSEEKTYYHENPKGTLYEFEENYEFLNWTADKDVKLKDGKVIKKGESLTEVQLKQVIVEDELIFILHNIKTLFTIYYKGSDLITITGTEQEIVKRGASPLGTKVQLKDVNGSIIWKSNKDLKLTDGTIIKRGEEITPELLTKVLVEDDVILTAYSKNMKKIDVPNTGKEKSLLIVTLGVILVSFGAYEISKRRRVNL